MYPTLSEALDNMNWFNPFDYYDLMLALFKVFGDFQSKLVNNFIKFFENGYTYGTEVLPHHHPILLSVIVFIYFVIFISIIIIISFIAGFVLCITNMFSAWIILLAIYVIFWRNPKLLEPQFIAFSSALFFILDIFNLW